MDMENRIDSFAILCFLIMLGFKRLDRVLNDRIYDITKLRPLIGHTRIRQLSFLSQILRMHGQGSAS